MAQTEIGKFKNAAKRIGISFEDYNNFQAQGLKWCFKCRSWVNVKNFGVDNSRYDNLKAKCFDCARVKNPRTTKGLPSPFKGQKHTPESRQKMSEANKGNQKAKGSKRTAAQRAYISQQTKKRVTLIGEKHPNWKGGISGEIMRIRKGSEIKLWRNFVFERDNFTCQHCGDNKGGNLQAHHIKSFADYPELRFEVSNGLTLCKPCHDKHHSK